MDKKSVKREFREAGELVCYSTDGIYGSYRPFPLECKDCAANKKGFCKEVDEEQGK